MTSLSCLAGVTFLIRSTPINPLSALAQNSGTCMDALRRVVFAPLRVFGAQMRVIDAPMRVTG